MRRLASGLLGVALVLCAGTASPVPLSDNTVRLLPSKFRLLQNIGPLRYTGSNRYTDRRLGRSFGYGASGISLTIYVYDFGMRSLPDGPDSVAACEQFERAKREIETGGNYQNVVLRREVTRRMRDTADAPLAREAVYEFDRNGIHATSLLWVTVADGYFVKLRLSMRSEVADEVDDARMQILATMAEAIMLEKEFIRDCLPVNAVGLSLDDFLIYIDYIADRRLEGVGLAPLTVGVKNPLPWLAEMMDIKKEQNFFEGRVTEYQKSSALNTVSDDEL